MTSDAVRPRRSAKGTRFASIVFERMHDPLRLAGRAAGVKQLDHASGDRRRDFRLDRSASETVSPRSRLRRPRRPAADHEDMFQRGQPGAHRPADGGAIDAAELGGNDEDLALGQTEHERKLAFAENDHQRIADRAELQARQMQDAELAPVRQLEGHDVAFPHAATAQADRDDVRKLVEFAIGQPGFDAALAAPGDDRRLFGRCREMAREMIEQRFVSPGAGRDHRLPARGEFPLLIHASSPASAPIDLLCGLRPKRSLVYGGKPPA